MRVFKWGWCQCRKRAKALCDTTGHHLHPSIKHSSDYCQHVRLSLHWKTTSFPWENPSLPLERWSPPRHECCLFKWLHKYAGDLQGGLLWFGEVYFKVYFHMMFGLLIRRVRVQDCTGSNSKLWRNFALGLLSLTKTKIKTVKTMFITLNKTLTKYIKIQV